MYIDLHCHCISPSPKEREIVSQRADELLRDEEEKKKKEERRKLKNKKVN